MRKFFHSFLQSRGYKKVRPEDFDQFTDFSPEDRKIISDAREFTMTSPARLAALLNAVDYVVRYKIPGDIAECGVWRGGSMMTVAHALLARNDVNRSLYLYDTFEGMSAPTDEDTSADGTKAEQLLQSSEKGSGPWHFGVWCYASLEDVQANLAGTGYPKHKVHFIKGKVEDTIPAKLPPRLSLLRLDTDWYNSTKHELEHLFPLLNKGGVLIIDDYGAWQGARKAVDEYFADKGPIFLHRIDETGRMLIRQ